MKKALVQVQTQKLISSSLLGKVANDARGGEVIKQTFDVNDSLMSVLIVCLVAYKYLNSK